MRFIFPDFCHAPSELTTVYGLIPPVAPEVIHIGLFQSHFFPHFTSKTLSFRVLAEGSPGFSGNKSNDKVSSSLLKDIGILFSFVNQLFKFVSVY
jgi:hypothetical protein